MGEVLDALIRLRELRAVSTLWRARHPDQVSPLRAYRSTTETRQAERAAADEVWQRLAVHGTLPPSVALWPEKALQHTVTGVEREDILDWLPTVCRCFSPPGERRALDDITVGTTGDDAERVLTSEGFTRELVTWIGDHRLRLLLHENDGLLAEVLEYRRPGKDPFLQHVQVYGVRSVVDRDLLFSFDIGIIFNPDFHGGLGRCVTVELYVHPWDSGSSLRVMLAVLRLASAPALRWPVPPIDCGIGPQDSLVPNRYELAPDSLAAAYRAATRDLLARLPEHVHDVLGPNLMPPS